MKLKQECVKDILNFLEEAITIKLDDSMRRDYNYTFGEPIHSNDIYKCEIINSKYTDEEIYYALMCLINFGYIEAKPFDNSKSCSWWNIYQPIKKKRIFHIL